MRIHLILLLIYSLFDIIHTFASANMATNRDVSMKVNEALTLHKTGKFQEAVHAYENVLPLLEKGKLASSLYSNVGAIYLQSGDYDNARKQFSNSVDAFSENAMAHFNLAIILTTKFNEHKLALKHCKIALKLDPNNHKVVHLIGNILQNLGQNEEADRYFIRAEEMVIEQQTPQQFEVQQDSIIKKDLSFLNIMKAKIGDTLEGDWDGNKYYMNCISERPLLFKLPSFITSDECTHIIKRATSSLEKSFIMGGNKDTNEPYRSSFNAWLSRDDILESILSRLEKITAIPISYLIQKSEELQVVKYENQGQFKLHHDSSNYHPRLFTLLLYLNDLPENAGGETYFPFTGIGRKFDYTIEDAISKGFIAHDEKLGTYCKPKSGDAILFFNYNIDGSIDTSAVHAGLPLKYDNDDTIFNNQMNKWIANYWVDYDIDLLLDLSMLSK